MTLTVVLAIAIFVATYALIATERLEKATAALAGGVAMILLGVVSQEQAFEHIDLNVIFLLAAMMVLAGIIRGTGVFGWMAVRAARIAAGDPYRLLVVLSIVTAVASAVLDNVTTVVLVGPVTLFVAAALGLNPMPLIISEIVASNIGGSATLIGDPPNILIGSSASLDFGAFLLNMLPLAVVVLGLYLLAARFIFARHLHVDPERRAELLALDESRMIEDPVLLRRSLIVLGGTLIGFILHGPLNYEPATIALGGAVVLMIVSRQDPREVFHEVEWPTLFFFIGLFMVVAGMIEVGVIDALAKAISQLTGDALAATSLLLLWMSATVSAIIDNIPYAATMTPLVHVLNANHGHAGDALWWSLAIGTDYGGNATIIGASANVILAAMAEREGHRISFGTYLRYGVPITVGTMLVASAYVWLRYLL
jgi:Na+/H+ antiporter NhaD/arsenite permease-like protein